jgi:hypothetical protein
MDLLFRTPNHQKNKLRRGVGGKEGRCKGGVIGRWSPLRATLPLLYNWPYWRPTNKAWLFWPGATRRGLRKVDGLSVKVASRRLSQHRCRRREGITHNVGRLALRVHTDTDC